MNTQNFRINKILIRNYKGYKEATAEFNNNKTVIIGINGAGKTVLLNAISISLSQLFSKFEGLNSIEFKNNDATLSSFNNNDNISNYPIEISASYEIGKEIIEWSCIKETSKSNIKKIPKKNAITLSDKINKIVKENAAFLLPIFAFYGADRNSEHGSSKKIIKNRLNAYSHAFESKINTKVINKWYKDNTYASLQNSEIKNDVVDVVEAINKATRVLYPEGYKLIYDIKADGLYVDFIENNVREHLPISSMSEGIKNTLYLLSDILIRIIYLNGSFSYSFEETTGIIMIDEIDLHLHPKWQKCIIDVLCNMLPNVQFIFTTHSPNVLVGIEKDDILLLNNHTITKIESYTYGRKVDAILNETMDTELEPQNVKEMKKAFDEFLDESKLDEATSVLNSLAKILSENDEFIIQGRISLALEDI